MVEQGGPYWEYIETRNVGSDRKITMPIEMRADFVVKNRANNDAVLWYWLMSAGVALLTSGLLEKGEYQNFGYTKYYSTDQFQFPKDLNHDLTYQVQEDDTVVFLAHEEMLSDEPKSMYVLSEEKALELLDNPVTDDLTTALKQQPAFFDPV